MAKKRTSPVWMITKKGLQDLLDKSSAITDVLKELGLDAYNGNHRTLNERIEIDDLQLDKFKRNRDVRRTKNAISKNTIPLKDILVENSTYKNNGNIKKRIVEEGLLVYKCCECGIDEWNGVEISLQLDHINGVNNDNRVENLRLLCPNCHSQTKTFSGRNAKIKNKCKCGKDIWKNSSMCVYCNRDSNRKFNPSKEELISKILELNCNISAVSRYYKVSDNSVRKRCKLLDIDYKSPAGVND